MDLNHRPPGPEQAAETLSYWPVQLVLREANFDEFFSCSMVRHDSILNWSTPQKDAKMLRDLMVEGALAARIQVVQIIPNTGK